MSRLHRLNLGCGKDYLKDWYHHDISKHSDFIDYVWDLNLIPYAIWKDNQFDEIKAYSVFEHLRPTLLETMNECHRILAPNGRIAIKFPRFSSETIYDDPTHIWHWSEKTLHYFDPTTKYGKEYDFYTDKKWRIIDLQVIKNRTVFAEMRTVK